MPHHQTTHHPPTNLLRRTKAQSNLDQLDDLRKMCDTINDELGRLAASLNHRHGGSTTAGAVLVYVTTGLFNHYGGQHKADLMPLLAVQRGAVDVFRAGQGLGSGTLDATLARANSTVTYMASSPE